MQIAEMTDRIDAIDARIHAINWLQANHGIFADEHQERHNLLTERDILQAGLDRADETAATLFAA